MSIRKRGKGGRYLFIFTDKLKHEKGEGFLFFFCMCQYFGFAFLAVTVKYIIYDPPSQRITELFRVWPIVLVCIILVVLGRWGSYSFKKRMRNDKNKIK